MFIFFSFLKPASFLTKEKKAKMISLFQLKSSNWKKKTKKNKSYLSMKICDSKIPSFFSIFKHLTFFSKLTLSKYFADALFPKKLKFKTFFFFFFYSIEKIAFYSLLKTKRIFQFLFIFSKFYLKIFWWKKNNFKNNLIKIRKK